MTSTHGATGAQLAHDKIDRYRSLGAFGKPVYQSHVQLRAMLKSKRGDKVANYFAKPTHDLELGELRWTAEVPGTARSWQEMSSQEQADRALDLEVVRSQLISFAQELRAESAGRPGGAASFASLLEQATKVPADGNFLYFVGDQPVIAFWGFEDRNGASVDPTAPAPRYAANAPAPAVVPAGGAPLAAGPLPPVPPVVVVKRKRPWWWWLLWALLALLLLLALLMLLRGCSPDPLGLEGALPGATAPDATASAAQLPDGTRVGPDGVMPGASGALPGGDLPPGALPPGGLPGADPAASGASMPGEGGLPPELPADKDKPALPEVPDATASAPMPNEPRAPETPRATPPDAAASQAPGDKRAVDKPRTDPPTVPPLEPPGARDLKMPDDPKAAKNMNFLEGDWQAGDGLFDKDTKQPLDLSLKFGKDGKGELSLRRPDGSTCRGTVSGRMNGGKLDIQGNQAIPCSDGKPYDAPKIECSKVRGGQTECQGVNADGSRYTMGMQRKK